MQVGNSEAVGAMTSVSAHWQVHGGLTSEKKGWATSSEVARRWGSIMGGWKHTGRMNSLRNTLKIM